MELPAIKNDELHRISKIALSRLARYSSVAEEKISQTFLCADDNFCGIRFGVGAFQAQWLFGHDHVVFMRGDQLIDQVWLSETGIPSKRAA